MLKETSITADSSRIIMDASKNPPKHQAASCGSRRVHPAQPDVLTRLKDWFVYSVNKFSTALSNRFVSCEEPVISSDVVERFKNLNLLEQYKDESIINNVQKEIDSIFANMYSDLTKNNVNEDSLRNQLFSDIERNYVKLVLQDDHKCDVIIDTDNNLAAPKKRYNSKEEINNACNRLFSEIEQLLAERKLNESSINFHRDRLLSFCHQGAVVLHYEIASRVIQDYVEYFQEKYKNSDQPTIGTFSMPSAECSSGENKQDQYNIFIPGNLQQKFINTQIVSREEYENILVKISYEPCINLIDLRNTVRASKSLNIIVCLGYSIKTDQPSLPQLEVVLVQDVADPEKSQDCLLFDFKHSRYERY